MFTEPALVTARMQVLDYFEHLVGSVPEHHRIFRFADGMHLGKGDMALLGQLSLQVGFEGYNDVNQIGRYFTGEDSDIVDNFPEFQFLRDVVFLFKALQSPTSDALPPVLAWKPRQAALRWAFLPSANPAAAQATFAVYGFGVQLKCTAAVLPSAPEKRSWLRPWIKESRSPQSGANPSSLVKGTIAAEDDVLHIRNEQVRACVGLFWFADYTLSRFLFAHAGWCVCFLSLFLSLSLLSPTFSFDFVLNQLPTFGGRLSCRDTELLLQYLTVPYLRVPLLMEFFSNPARIKALGEPDLQNVLDSCLFEPGELLLFTADTLCESSSHVDSLPQYIGLMPRRAVAEGRRRGGSADHGPRGWAHYNVDPSRRADQ